MTLAPDAATGTVGWTVSLQDFRGRAPGSREKLPKVVRQWFSTREEAEARKAHLRELNQSDLVLLCISPARFRAPKPKEIKKPAQHGLMDWTSS